MKQKSQKPSQTFDRYLVRGRRGFSLIEILICIVLMGFLSLSITNLLIKGNSTSASMELRYRQGVEVQNFILNLQQDLQQGAYISNNSYNKRLEYTTYDDSASAVKKVFAVCYAPSSVASTDTSCGSSSGTNDTAYLKKSLDGGTTWESPYLLSGFNKYKLTGTPQFLYAQEANNCTAFTDTNGNGVWSATPTDAAASAACGSYSTSSPILDRPSQASKIVLSSFQFTANSGAQPVARSLPPNIFMRAPLGPVISTMAAVSPGAKDSPLLTSFVTNTANSLFGTSFDVRGVYWNASHQRLIVVGHHSSNNNQILQMERNGVRIAPVYTTLDATVQLEDVALMEDDETLIALDDSSKILYFYTLSPINPILTPIQTLNLGNPSLSSPSLTPTGNLVNSPTGILYDPRYPNEVFVVGTDPADSNPKILEINYKTGALATSLLSGGKLALPAAFDSSHPPGGISQEPSTGDFLVVRDYVNGVSTSRTIDIYRITSSGSYTSFSVNINDIGSSTTGTNGNWGLSYSPETNHLFLSDTGSDKIYEVYPSVLITPR
jgi:prepilin-type N-terminal cleavage/methylation domain-containing protein